MKKSLTTVAFIATSMFSFISYVKAQEGFRLGVEGTPQMNWLMNKDDQDNSKFDPQSTYGAAFGISGQYGFTPDMGLGLNVLYSFQGQKYKWNGAERSKRVEYIKIPLMYLVHIDVGSDMLFIGKIGPQLGLLTNAKLVDKDWNNIVSDHKAAYMDYDIGAVASAGMGFKLSDNVMLDAALRFDYSFTDAEDKDYTRNINDPFPAAASNGGTASGASAIVNNTNRATTSNMTAGLTVGFRYLIR